jgi:hypothetical protein
MNFLKVLHRLSPLAKKYLLALVINPIVAVIAVVVYALFIDHSVTSLVGVYAGVILVLCAKDTLGLLITHFTLKWIIKKFGLSYQDAYKAYVVYKFQKDLPITKWTNTWLEGKLLLKLMEEA